MGTFLKIINLFSVNSVIGCIYTNQVSSNIWNQSIILSLQTIGLILVIFVMKVLKTDGNWVVTSIWYMKWTQLALFAIRLFSWNPIWKNILPQFMKVRSLTNVRNVIWISHKKEAWNHILTIFMREKSTNTNAHGVMSALIRRNCYNNILLLSMKEKSLFSALFVKSVVKVKEAYRLFSIRVCLFLHQ